MSGSSGSGGGGGCCGCFDALRQRLMPRNSPIRYAPDPARNDTGRPSAPVPPSKPAIRSMKSNDEVVRALYDYSAREDGDLAFRKGDTMKIINKVDGDWWLAKHMKTKMQGSIPSNFVVPLKHNEWQEWWFDVDRRDAVKQLILPGNPRGAFLIRKSTKPDSYAMSVRDFDETHSDASVKHYCIHEKKPASNELVLYINRKARFKSLAELVQHYTEQADGLCCKLVQPCCKVPEALPFKALEVRRTDIVLGAKLGAGKFGAVFKGKYKNNHDVAVKILQAPEGQATQMSPKEFLEEAKRLHQLRHRQLVQLMGVCTTQEPMYIITELMSHGDLLNYLRKDQGTTLDLIKIIDICAQIAEGMAYLEEKQYVHRDLRAANILVGDHLTVKVADFGLARLLTDDNFNDQTMFPIKWTAPEVLFDHNDLSTKSDVWSFGVLLYEIVTYGAQPYPGMSNTQAQDYVQNGGRLKRPGGAMQTVCSDKIYDVMKSCWDSDRDRRPTFSYLASLFGDYYTEVEHMYVEEDQEDDDNDDTG